MVVHASNNPSIGDMTPECLRVRVEQRMKTWEKVRRFRAREWVRLQAVRSATASAGHSKFRNSFCLERAASMHAKELVHKFNELTGGSGLQYQKAMLSKLLSQPMLQPVLPDFVAKRAELEHCRVVCNGLKDAWSSLKYGVGKDKYLARNVIEAAVISVDDEKCIQAATSCIGMNKRTLRRAILRRQRLNKGIRGEVWAKNDRRKRRDSLEQSVIDIVVTWWTEETRVSPCKKDVRRKRIGLKKYISHATHWLEESQLDFYTRFKGVHNNIKVSFASFRRLRPYFVKRLQDFNSCCCRHHQEMAEITVGFNNMRAKQFHLELGTNACCCGCDSLCSNPPNGIAAEGAVTCQSMQHTYRRATNLWELSLCPKLPGSEWHLLDCIRRRCNKCGIEKIPFCERELDPDNSCLLAWRRFEMVHAGKTKTGAPKKTIRLEYKLTTAKVFIDFATAKIKEFVLHQHVARWQDTEYRESLNNLKEGEVLSLIDFAENYSFKSQNEIQSQHWYSFQLTILVHITYMVNPDYSPLIPGSKRLRTDYYYYISDDRCHDSLFVQYCLNIHWKSMHLVGKIPSRHIVWSDGCAAQFKSATCWFYVSRYPSMTRCGDLPLGCQMDWHFWGTGHGKGPHDGAGACLKQALRKEQLKPTSTRLQSASDVVQFLEVAMNLPNASYPGAKRTVNRHFHLIGEIEVSRENPMACSTIQGSRSMHSVRSVSTHNNVLLEVRDFSCFCLSCVDRTSNSIDCPNMSYVAPWKLVTLQPINAEAAIQESDDLDQHWSAEPDANLLASELEVGDHFAIVADPSDLEADGADFFVLLCTKPMYIVESETLTDTWKGTVERGDEVIEGLYYKQQGSKQNSYILLQSLGIARIYSHLVCASKFSMRQAKHKQKGNTCVYQLSKDALSKIQAVVRSKQQLEELESGDGDSQEFDFDDAEFSSGDSDYNSDLDE